HACKLERRPVAPCVLPVDHGDDPPVPRKEVPRMEVAVDRTHAEIPSACNPIAKLLEGANERRRLLDDAPVPPIVGLPVTVADREYVRALLADRPCERASVQTCEEHGQLVSILRFPIPNFTAFYKGKHGDDPAVVDVERRPVEGLERRQHLLDLVREEAHEVVLPANALQLHPLDADRKVTGTEERAARPTAQPVPLRRHRDPVALGDTFREWL